MTKEVISRFFRKQCTRKEAREAIDYFDKNPAALDEYLNKTEWDTTEPGGSLTEESRDEIWSEIIKKRKEGLIIFWVKRTAVAASIGSLLFFGYDKFIKPGKLNRYPISALAPGKSIRATAKTAYNVVVNDQKKVKYITLMDSSGICLYPHSQVAYYVPFRDNKREIYLKGAAYFKVSKDKTKPFTVYAGALATTALGTKFRITTKKDVPGDVTVTLFTGKVSIRSIDTGLQGLSKEIYLLPGQQMKYDARKMLVSVEKINDHKISDGDGSEAMLKGGGELNFNGASLSYVIDKLSTYFNTRIAYKKPEIKAMNFTGTINKNDSLINVLKAIGQMNDLEILQQDNGFTLQKRSK